MVRDQAEPHRGGSEKIAAPTTEHEQRAAKWVLREPLCTIAASPSKPYRMSVRPAASQIRAPEGKPIIAADR
jgi:hypothetical protein